MGAHYIINCISSSDASAKRAQMNEEQAALLTALGLTLDSSSTEFIDDSWRLTRTDSSNEFIACGGKTGTMYLKDERNQTISGGTSQYFHFLFTENSIMIATNSYESPTSGCSAITIITKNTDGKVIAIGVYEQGSNRPEISYIKDKNYGNAGIPCISSKSDVSTPNFSQISLANVPMQQPGALCDNAFIVLCQQSVIYADLSVISGVEYAVASTGYASFACK